MDSSYVYLCGVMWCNYGAQDAGQELMRATGCDDPNVKAMAWAMLAKGMARQKTRARELRGY